MIVRRVSPWGPWWTTPSADLAQVRQEMESLMERLIGAAPAPDGSAAGVFPPMNVSQDGEHYYVRALIPGVDASHLDVAVVNRTLTVSGMRRPVEETGVSYHRRERPEGAFSRSVTLPAEFEGARVQARYLDGVLTLTLPKPEAAKPRRVTVQTA
jgi:HSP20 family protein